MASSDDTDADPEFQPASDLADADHDDRESCERCSATRKCWELSLTAVPYGLLCHPCLATLPREDDHRRPGLAADAESDAQLLGLLRDEVARAEGPRQPVVAAINQERERFKT